MAFTSTSQSDTFTMGPYFAVLFTGTAGASGNTITLNFTATNIIGLEPTATFSQSGATVTVSGLTNTQTQSFLLLGSVTL